METAPCRCAGRGSCLAVSMPLLGFSCVSLGKYRATGPAKPSRSYGGTGPGSSPGRGSPALPKAAQASLSPRLSPLLHPGYSISGH